MVVSQRKKTRKQGGDRQEAEDERRVREGGEDRGVWSSRVQMKKRLFWEERWKLSRHREILRVCVSNRGSKKQIFRLDIVNTSACQSQGFPLCLFHVFLSLQTIYTQSSRLHAAHIRVTSTLTLEDSGTAASVEASQLLSLFSRLTPAVLIFKTLPRHFFRLWWLYRKAEGLRKAYTSENKGTKKKRCVCYYRGDVSNNERFMTGIESRRWFYQPIINQITPTEMYHISALFCTLTALYPSLTPWDQCSPPPSSSYITWLSQSYRLSFTLLP